ncbi:hypothetical protein AFK68_16410 [Hydrocoleum sp. CS-953]|nr:hypothetical protein AFK68_16410 [Hydrocoleum sp. CS-953]
MLGEPPVENTEDVFEAPIVGGMLGEPPAQNPEDVPEPSKVIGLLGVGFAGSLLKKKSTKSHN